MTISPPTPAGAPRLFGTILPYEAEVCEPNAEPVRAWVTDRYGQEAQRNFEVWLRAHDRDLLASRGVSSPDASIERDSENHEAIPESRGDRQDDRAASSPQWGDTIHQERFRSPHNQDPECPFLKTNAGCIWCCTYCNHDAHECMKCGQPLTHLSRNMDGTKHDCP